MIKATLLLLCAICVIPRLRRRSAAERHLFWAVTLGAASVLPLLGLLLPSWEPDWARHVMALFPPSFDAGSAALAGQTADIVVRANGIESAPWSLGGLLPLLWVLGTCVALLMLAAEALQLARFAFSARPVTDRRSQQLAADVARAFHLTRPIQFLQSARGIIPVTWGLRQPRVMLPACATDWSAARTRAVLAHELAHIRRGDWVVHVLAELICAVYWFHPLFWMTKNRLCRDSEDAADDEVLGLGVEGGEYATHLLEIVRAAQAPVRAWSPTIAMARPSQLERRFTALLNRYANRRAITWRKALATMGIAVLVVIPLAAIMGARGVAPNVEIRTANLPAITEPTATFGLERAAPAVRNVRVVGVGDTPDAVTRPEIVEYTTPPLYSDEARRRGIEGLVTVGAQVEIDGRVSAARVVQGLGFGLDQNALVALRQWRFRPGTRAGRPVAMNAEVDVEFSLRNEAVNEVIANDMATRVGPGVTPPRAVRMFALWPRRPRISGTVVLDVVLLEDGTPKIVKILQSLDPVLDETAIRNFERWKFSPAMKNGRPVKVRMNAEVHFHG
jgi:TonB family protein